MKVKANRHLYKKNEKIQKIVVVVVNHENRKTERFLE
jgi:hypothetical protein